MDTTLYLHSDEEKLFTALPADLKKRWVVKDENFESYETPEELALRREMFHPDDPKLLKVLQNLHADEAATATALLRTGLPQTVLHDLLFTVGAVTLRNAIRIMLPVVLSRDDLESVALLSMYRHALLDANTKSLSV